MEKRRRRTLQHSNAADLVKDPNAPEQNSRYSGAIFFLLGVILIFSTLAYGAVETWAFGFLSIFTGIILVLWLFETRRTSEIKFGKSPLQIPLLGLILIGLIQLLPLKSPEIADNLLLIPAVSSLSINPYATRLAVVQLIIYAVFFAAAFVFINTTERLRKIAALIVIFGAVMAFFGILQRLASPEGIYGWRPTPQAIPFASFVNQHHFAAFMEMTFGLTLAILVGKATGKDKRALLIAAVALMGISILFTGSRGGLLSLLGVTGFVLITNFLRKEKSDKEISKNDKRAIFRRKIAFIGGFLALFFVLFGAVVLLGGDTALLRGVGYTAQTDVSSGRLHFWGVALDIFKNNPILGAGLDAFGTAFPRYDMWNGNLRVEQAHNDYLQILADAGVAGFLCVAGFIFLLFKQGLQRIGAEHDRFRLSVSIGALAGCFGILLHSFFDFPLRTPSNAFYFLIFAFLATTSIYLPKNQRRLK